MGVADVVICGAGIAGISAAYHLSLRKPSLRILLVDSGPPLGLTSDKSTEAYRTGGRARRGDGPPDEPEH
jgi:sarcosine oxidase subunit beta